MPAGWGKYLSAGWQFCRQGGSFQSTWNRFSGVYAGLFAAKEAIAKALGTGFRAFMPIDIEVLRNELGKPYVNLYGGAAKRAFELNVGIIHVTITNTKEYAQAFAVAEEQ